MMKGVGGPLLCIGDLLNDVGEGADDSPFSPSSSSSSSSPTLSADTLNLHPSHLSTLFQENYNKLNEVFAGTDHSWTASTLKLCVALESANKLVQLTDTHAEVVAEKIEELEKVVKRSDSTIASAKSIHTSLNQKGEE
ncbi:uncharacterized protein LOC124923960 [Impatiens glandulifera]|uniref:uncharacterized protein LOC124923960 n=1 Tax=Impatiens glandulifera TaxID=253017 RepID=UPI001FB12B95|nr:uncharacterized protein LOC124923960 [Impatiens glandulifera]